MKHLTLQEANELRTIVKRLRQISRHIDYGYKDLLDAAATIDRVSDSWQPS